MSHQQSSFDAELGRLTDAARREQAREERRKRADRSVVSALSATFAGTLLELLETREPATFLTRAGSTIRGTVIALGSDVVVISSASAQSVVRLTALEAVRERGQGHDRDSSAPLEGRAFAELLDTFAADRRRLSMTLGSGNQIMGVIERVGQDQVVLRLDGEADTLTVFLPAIDEVVLDQ